MLVDGTGGKLVGLVDNISVITDFLTMRGNIDVSFNDINNVNLLNATNIVSDQILSTEFVGDLRGSVFSDNSTLLVDAVSGSIPYAVISDTPTSLSQFLNDLDYAGIVGAAIQNNGLPVDTFLTGNLNAQGNNINDVNLVNATGDLKGSVFSDNSTMLVDGVNGVVFAENIVGTFTGNVVGDTNGYHTGDVTGSIFSDNSTLLVDSANGIIPGYISIQQLKDIVSAANDYNEFQTAIAVL
jgi:hypothetical protein